MNRHVTDDFHSHDPDRQVGEIFRRLSSMRFQFGEDAFERVTKAVFQALGAAAMAEAERHAAYIRHRAGFRPGDYGLDLTPRRIEVDDWPGGDGTD